MAACAGVLGWLGSRTYYFAKKPKLDFSHGLGKAAKRLTIAGAVLFALVAALILLLYFVAAR